MALERIIAELQVTLQRERANQKRHRYHIEEVAVERVRADLETGDREQWLQDTLETEAILG